jgi:hypothetical protein
LVSASARAPSSRRLSSSFLEAWRNITCAVDWAHDNCIVGRVLTCFGIECILPKPSCAFLNLSAPRWAQDKYCHASAISSQPHLVIQQTLFEQSLGIRPKNISSHTHYPQMLVPPRLNEAAAYASIRRDSVARPTKQNSPARFLRQSFQRQSRFVDRQNSRGRAISHHPLRTSVISSDNSTLDSPPDWEFDARSIITFGSSETLDNDASFSESGNATDKPSFRCVNTERFPRFVGGKETELVLSSSLQKIGVDID